MRNIHKNHSKTTFSPAHPYQRQCSILSPHICGQRTLHHSRGLFPTFLLLLWRLLLQGPPETVEEHRGEREEVEWAVRACVHSCALMCIHVHGCVCVPGEECVYMCVRSFPKESKVCKITYSLT